MNELLRKAEKSPSPELSIEEIQGLIADMETELNDFSDEVPEVMIHATRGGGATYKIQSGWFAAAWLDIETALEVIGDKQFEYKVRHQAQAVITAVADRKRNGGDTPNLPQEVETITDSLKQVIARLKIVKEEAENESKAAA